MPGSGARDPGGIWALGFAIVASLLLWSKQFVEKAAATPLNNPSAASCSLASVDPAFPFRSLAGLGGEEGSGSGRDLGGSGRS
jgi:hypothetical protein